MYQFIDVTATGATGATGSTGTVNLPAEAVKINGLYIEEAIKGYQTLYVSGRESLEKQIETMSVGSADGERILSTRYPSRTLTVGFQLVAADAAEFREKFNNLNNILAQDEADFVFNDESDKFFTGVAIMDADIEPGRNAVTGEWHILCTYPYKRTTALTTLSSDDASGVDVGESSATFTFNYKGTRPTRPILRAKFAAAKEGGDFSEDGDCGFVAFLDDEENIIQLGNPDVIDIDDPTVANATFINSEFTELTGWTDTNVSIGTMSDQYWDRGSGQTQSYAKPSGTTAGLVRALSGNGASNFSLDMVHRLCVSAAGQTGKFECLAKNNNKVVVGFKIEKTGSGTTGTASYIVDDKIVGTDTIDLSLYNTNFGYCNRTPVYVTQTYKEARTRTVTKKVKTKKGKKKKKKVTETYYVTATRQVQNGWNYTQSNLNSGFDRDDSVVTFAIGNLAEKTFKSSGIVGVAVTSVVINMTGDMNTNALHSIDMIGKAGVPFAEIPNVFTAGDIVEADCNDASVFLYRKGSLVGHKEPQYGALGNDWEDFEIKPGQNVIRAVWSNWVDANYKPLIQIIFNEVYL